MQTQVVVSQRLIEKMQVLIDQPIWRVIHPADGWLFIDLGKKYQDIIPGLGEEIPYTKGEFQVRIKGAWSLLYNGKVRATRKLKCGETQAAYFDRMETLVNDLYWTPKAGHPV